MEPKTIWHLPKVIYQSLSELKEHRPAAVITEVNRWERVGSLLNVPVVVQAEPERSDYPFLQYLAENVPSSVEVVYAVGGSPQVAAGKVVAAENNIPLVIVPTELDSDQIFEPHVEVMQEGILTDIFMGAAEQIIVDWDVIKAAEPHVRAGMVADMLAIVTGLLDWRYAVKVGKNSVDHPFSPWAASVAATIASQLLKAAPAIGQGDVEAMKMLMDLTGLSVQLANQLGHDRHQEGTEHYFAFALEKQGVTTASHAECLGPGILLTSALHGQDPSHLRQALEGAGIRLDALRQADVQLAISELPVFSETNGLPYAIAHDIDPFSDTIRQAVERAGLMGDTGGWAVTGETGAMVPMTPSEKTPPQTLPVATPGQATDFEGPTVVPGADPYQTLPPDGLDTSSMQQASGQSPMPPVDPNQ